MTTYVLVVTDMSGSMTILAEEVRSGFNAYLDELHRAGGDYRVSVTLFDTEFIPLCVAVPLIEVPRFTEDNYKPRGMTALLDAVGKTVAEFDAKVTLAAADRVLLVIQTDGHENSSSEFTWTTVRDSLEARAATGQWSIVYLGQGINAWGQGERFGASTQIVRTAAFGAATTSIYRGLATATVDYAQGAPAADTGATIAATPGVVDENPTT